jgi:GxxExxY protein
MTMGNTLERDCSRENAKARKETRMTYNSGDAKAEELITSVIDSAVEVHRHLGPGHQEKHYENALCHEFDLRRIPYARQVRVKLEYKGKEIGEGVVDLLVGGCLIVELKAIECLTDLHFAQVVSYLNIQQMRLGVLLTST